MKPQNKRAWGRRRTKDTEGVGNQDMRKIIVSFPSVLYLLLLSAMACNRETDRERKNKSKRKIEVILEFCCLGRLQGKERLDSLSILLLASLTLPFFLSIPLLSNSRQELDRGNERMEQGTGKRTKEREEPGNRDLGLGRER